MMSNAGNGSNGSEIGVSSKTFQGQVVGIDIGLKLKLQNQSRSFWCNEGDDLSRSAIDDDDGDGDGNGPTYSSCGIITDIYDVAVSANSSSSGLRVLQPFHVSCPPTLPFFKPSASGGMATAAMGYPFTAAQWKELERQAMIYKYMVASLPVPPDLLYSTFPTNLSPPITFTPASYLVGNGLNLSWSGNSKDAEPGRCRRTDGKKWRCSRDVAPNQKYCERHMHRGRPRSRKPVELLSNFPISTKNNNPPKKTRLDGSSSSSNSKPAGSSLPSIPPSKAPTFDHPMGTNVNPFEDSRWKEEQQWQHLLQANMNSLSNFQLQFEGAPLNLNSQADLSSESDMGLLKRPLLDAWSMGVTGSKDNGVTNKSSLVAYRDSDGNAIDEDRCKIHMGLGVIDSWVASPSSPGGPLAEVLRPGPFTAPCKSASDAGESELVTPPATAVSSPSGVLQKTFASLSDSSGSNSPTCQNSKTNSDMPFHWLN